VALFGSVVLALPNRALPTTTARHAYLAASGLVLLRFLLGGDKIWYPLAITGGCYMLLWLVITVPALKRTEWWPWAVAGTAMGYLLWLHVGHVSTSSIDESAIQMVLTVKLFTLAFNLYDGTTGAAEIAARIAAAEAAAASAAKRHDASAQVKAAATLTVFGDRRDRAITSLPSLLEYLGYCLNVTTVLVGPSFEFGVYAREQRQWGNGNSPPPVSRLPAVLVTLLQGVFFMSLNALLQPMVPIEGVFDLAAKPGASFWRLLLFLHVSYLARRMGYYAVWKVAEAAAVTAGFGHQQAIGCADAGAGKHKTARASCSSRSGKRATHAGVAASESNTTCLQRTRASVTAWSGAANINPLACELPGSPSDVMRNWNTHVQSWLQRYIYLRAPRAFGLNRLTAFFASALWHGIAIGYFAGFLSLPIMQAAWSEVAGLWACWQPPTWAAGPGLVGRMMRAGGSVLQRAMRAGVTLLLLDYCLSAFTMLELGKTLVVWRGLWFFGHVGAAIVLASGCALRRSGLRPFRSSFAAV